MNVQLEFCPNCGSKNTRREAKKPGLRIVAEDAPKEEAPRELSEEENEIMEEIKSLQIIKGQGSLTAVGEKKLEDLRKQLDSMKSG